ncbi:MAG: phage terminase large subunit, partial [Thermomicrobiales bacterium]|nr:phage terminase large subunit [Thermomicrobiales bacterium]
YPGMRGLILRKTLESLKDSALVTFQNRVLHPLDGVVFYGGSKAKPAAFIYPNGSTIAIGGMDKPTKIMSAEYDMALVVEATDFTENDWETVTVRLRNGVMPYQQLLADCNPDVPTHWLNRRCNDGKTARLLSRHEDNPALWDVTLQQWTAQGADYIAKLNALTGVRYKRLRLGQWAAAEGQIYEQWDSAVHLIDRFEIPADWPRFWVIDFGFTNPFVWQAWALKPDGDLVMYREIYMTRRLVADHAKTILQITAGEPIPVDIITDHDAEDRATFERETGFSTTAANKAVSPGIQAVARRLQPNARPAVHFFRDAVVERDQELVDSGKPASTVEEFPSYVWDTRQGQAKGERPVKEDDHGMDATRYLVAHFDLDDRADMSEVVNAYAYELE